MKLLLGLSVLMILIFLGMFYSRFCKKTADEFVREIIEEKIKGKKIGENHSGDY